MALTTLYFGVTSAGADDGSDYANRKALVVSNALNVAIRGFDFTGSNALRVMIGPGSYDSINANLLVTATNPWTSGTPSNANPVYFVGCDDQGNELVPPADWTPEMPAWTTPALPVLTFGSINYVQTGDWFMVKLTSARSGAVTQGGNYSWCQIENTGSNTSCRAASSVLLSNCVLKCSGTAYSDCCSSVSALGSYRTRFEGNSAASSGNRHGVNEAIGVPLTECVIVNHPGSGVVLAASATRSMTLRGCTVANCGGDGANVSTSSGAAFLYADGCSLTGNGGYGINIGTNGFLSSSNLRLRDNIGGNINGASNRLPVGNLYETDTDDATEYVDAANGDFRIKASAATWRKTYGTAPGPATITG